MQEDEFVLRKRKAGRKEGEGVGMEGAGGNG